MRILTTALLAAGALALSACGGGAETNVAANNTAEEAVYNVAPDELGNDTSLGNEATGNEAGEADANATEADANASSNATNSH